MFVILNVVKDLRLFFACFAVKAEDAAMSNLRCFAETLPEKQPQILRRCASSG
jgi:hypothetical protein